MSHRNNLIPFPASPPFAKPRKPGASSIAESMEHIASDLPALLIDVKLDIVRSWRRGVRISWLAKIHQLRVVQIEALLWIELGQRPTPVYRRAA
jgi:hypothetical protein